MCAEGLNDNVPQSSIRVDGRLVCFLAGFWELGAVDVELELVGKFLPCKRFQASNAVP